MIIHKFVGDEVADDDTLETLCGIRVAQERTRSIYKFVTCRQCLELRPVKKRKPGRMRKFKWVVEITVDKTWVEDGFELTNDRANDMVRKEVAYAYGHEVSARVLSAPPQDEIKRVQGFPVKKGKK